MNPTPTRRGRPPLASREQVLHQIRSISQEGRLFRVHIEHPALYARARRHHGSWAAALQAAGIGYDAVLADARRRSIDTRRKREPAF
jgi:hypothetical protein